MEHIIKFTHLRLEFEINTELGVEDLNLPGIFAVECLKTQRLFFVGAEDTLLEISEFFSNVEKEKIYRLNFFEDLKKYGRDSFKFLIFDLDQDFENPQKRYLKILFYNQMYANNLY